MGRILPHGMSGARVHITRVRDERSPPRLSHTVLGWGIIRSPSQVFFNNHCPEQREGERNPLTNIGRMNFLNGRHKSSGAICAFSGLVPRSLNSFGRNPKNFGYGSAQNLTDTPVSLTVSRRRLAQNF